VPFLKPFLILLLVFGLSPGSLLAQSSPSPIPSAGGEKLNPIEVYFTTLSGLRYLQGDQLLSDQELRALIDSQGDPESLRMMETSKNSASIGILGLGIGLPLAAAGVIAATDNTADTKNVLTGLGVALGGLCFTTAGALLTAEGNTAKFNSVQRFNQDVRKAGPSSDSSPSAQEMKIQPIDVRLSTLGGWGYSVRGKELRWPDDFDKRIDDLNDFEAGRLIKKSKSSGFISQILNGLGIGGEIAIIALHPGSNNGGDRIGFWFPLIGSFLAVETGAYFQMEATTAKFNAVKRYNRFARGEEQVLPQGPQDEKSLMDFNSHGEPSQK